MLNYSARAARALGFLKRHYNDVEIYVEDTANRNMWLRLLETILPDRVRLSSVNVLGGRNKVLTACKLDQGADGRRRLYIIDGDFDFLHGAKKPKLRNLYRLNAYCVENIILRPESVVEVGFNNCTDSSKDLIARRIDFDDAIRPHENLLRSLFVIYATVEKLALGLTTVGYSVHRVMTKREGQLLLDPLKLKQRIRSLLKDAVLRVGVRVFSTARREVGARATGLSLDQMISGKAYLLPIIWYRLRTLSDCSIQIEQFKVQLASRFRAEYEPWLARRIRKVCAG
ncbi:DUF4435 domain-containing protein [Mesorhizobium sp.]|uniref:DUF4435 domain-containing protein n=1 Tax=Mesorhizobium sp. TaxID=1871066 RepID=UPI0011FD2255|nr:DUF4435 domain-containing protein [Mesorhizobium sp.]TIS67990.1 MAG: DUF4435 domain-containing protein [Mesorhizobium sp.]